MCQNTGCKLIYVYGIGGLQSCTQKNTQVTCFELVLQYALKICLKPSPLEGQKSLQWLISFMKFLRKFLEVSLLWFSFKFFSGISYSVIILLRPTKGWAVFVKNNLSFVPHGEEKYYPCLILHNECLHFLFSRYISVCANVMLFSYIIACQIADLCFNSPRLAPGSGAADGATGPGGHCTIQNYCKNILSS